MTNSTHNLSFISWEPAGRDDRQNGEFKILRPYQFEGHIETRDALYRRYIMPVGSGKSFMLISNSIYDAHHYKDSSLTLVPQKIIGFGFQDELLHVPDIGDQEYIVRQKFNLIRPTWQPKVDRWLSFVNSDSPENAVSTYAGFIKFFRFLKDTNQLFALNGLRIRIDEIQHLMYADENVKNILGGIVHEIITSDLDVGFDLVTATDFRTDRMPLLPQEILDMFVEYRLPWDKYCVQMQYLKGFRINLHTFDDSPAKAIGTDLRKPIRTMLHIPVTNSSFYQDDMTPTSLVEDLKKEISPNKYVREGEDDCWCYVTYRNGKKIRVIDLADQNEAHRKPQLKYIQQYRKDPELAPDYVFAMNMCIEGSDLPYMARTYVIGFRNSFQVHSQIVGRPLRDVEGKEYAEYNIVLRRGNVRETVIEDYNNFLKIMVLAMMMEDRFRTPILTRAQRTENENTDGVRNSITDDVNYEEILTAIVKHLRDEDLEDEEACDMIAAILDQYDVEDIDDDKIFKYLHAFKRRIARNLINFTPEFDADDFDIDLLEDITASELVRTYFSKQLKPETFDWFRKKINESKEHNIQLAHTLCDFIDNNDRPPYKSNEDEYSLALFHMGIKEAKLGKGNRKWCRELQDVVNERGYSDLWTTVRLPREESGLSSLEEILQFIKDNNQAPREYVRKKDKGNEKAEAEGKLGTALKTIRNGRLNMKHFTAGKQIVYEYFDTWEAFIQENELEYYFTDHNSRKLNRFVKRLDEFCEIYKQKEESLPSSVGEEQSCYLWYTRTKNTVRFENKKSYIPSNFKQLCDEREIPYTLFSEDNRVTIETGVPFIVEYYERTKLLPKPSAEDETEQAYAKWFYEARRVRTDEYTQKMREMLDDEYKFLMDVGNDELQAVCTTRQCVAYYKQHERRPPAGWGKPGYELYKFAEKFRRGAASLYPSVKKVAVEGGIGDWFGV